jgi:hypothetical protein
MQDNTKDLLISLKDCLELDGFQQVLTLKIRKLPVDDRFSVISDINQIIESNSLKA